MHNVTPLHVTVWHFFGTPGATPLIYQSEAKIGAQYYPGEDFGDLPTPISIMFEIAKTHVAQFRLSKLGWKQFKKMVDNELRTHRNTPENITDIEPEHQN